MLEFTSGLQQSLLDLARAERTTTRRSQELASGRRVNSPQDDPSAWVDVHRTRSRVSSLDAIHTSMNVAATNIQVADTTMDAIGKDLDLIKGQLVEALAYPAGHVARDRLIRGANDVRRQIDLMVNTTTDEGARKLMADPRLFPDAGDLPVLIDPEGTRQTGHARQVHTGAAGLNLADVDPAASNADLTSAVEAVDRAKQTLAERRFGLASDAANVTRRQAENARLTGLYEDHAQAVEAADPAETGAALKSADVQRSLALEMLSSITTMRSQLMELLQ